jgi:hypothetical protein
MERIALAVTCCQPRQSALQADGTTRTLLFESQMSPND